MGVAARARMVGMKEERFMVERIWLIVRERVSTAGR